MKFEGDRILAENYDGLGLVNDMERNLGVGMRGRRSIRVVARRAAGNQDFDRPVVGPVELKSTTGPVERVE